MGAGGADTFYEHLGDSTATATNYDDDDFDDFGQHDDDDEHDYARTRRLPISIMSTNFTSGTDHIVFGGHNALIATTVSGCPG